LFEGGVGSDGAVDDVGEAAFEDAECFKSTVAVGASAGQQGSRVGMKAGLGERDAVQRSVELPVAAAAESVACSVR
jgi:hypothetical protein